MRVEFATAGQEPSPPPGTTLDLDIFPLQCPLGAPGVCPEAFIMLYSIQYAEEIVK